MNILQTTESRFAWYLQRISLHINFKLTLGPTGPSKPDLPTFPMSPCENTTKLSLASNGSHSLEKS